MSAKKRKTTTVEYRHEFMNPSLSDGEWHQYGLCTATSTGADVTRPAEWECEPLCYDKTSDGGAIP